MKTHLLALLATPLLAFAGNKALAATPAAAATEVATKPPAKPTLSPNYGKLPLSFEANQGQTDPRVKFLSRGQGYSLFLTDKAAILSLTKAKSNHPGRPIPNDSSTVLKDGKPRKPASAPLKTDVVRMELAGASPNLHIEGADQLPGIANYFIGSDPTKWHSNIPTYARVKYAGVYPGVDLVYYGNQRQLEYDFVVAPGASPKPVKLLFAGAEKLKIDASGDLTVTAKNGEIAFHKPVVYQLRTGRQEPVDGEFILLSGNTVGFKLGDYDRSRELVIDPVLAYSTYLGTDSIGTAIAIDPVGEAVVTGYAGAAGFPSTPGSVQPVSPSFSGGPFVAKLNAAGSALLYATYLGDDGGEDSSTGIAVESTGNAYIVGYTYSANFPTTPGAVQPAKPNTTSTVGFVSKLDAAGSTLLYSTYLGGPGGKGGRVDGAYGVALDSDRHAYVTGYTSSHYFPVTGGAFQTVNNESNPHSATGFIAKFSTDGAHLLYSTYLGGSTETNGFGGDYPVAIAVDSSGSAYVTGSTSSPDFPTTPGAFQTTGNANGFVTKLNPIGAALTYSTLFLAGPQAIAVDGVGAAYVTGQLEGTGLPTTPGAFQGSGGHGYPAYVTKFDPTGSSLDYSTYLNGSGDSGARSIAVDGQGRAIVTGSTDKSDFPVTPDAYQDGSSFGKGGTSPFLTQFNSAGTALVYSTLLYGSHASEYTQGNGIGLDSLGNAYFTGETTSSHFPVTGGAFQTTGNNGSEAFVSKFAFNGATTTTLSANANPLSSGSDLILTATVAPVGGGASPTGLVAFSIDGSSVGHASLDGSGTAVYSNDSLPVGIHTVKANYLGDPAAFSASGTGTTQTIIGQVATPTFPAVGGTFRMAVNVVIETSTLGAKIHYTTNGATPTTASATYIGPINVFETTTIKAIADEAGDTNSGIATATFTIAPNAITTATALTSSNNPSASGEPVTFAATVTAVSGPTPTGTVTFKNGSVDLATVPLVSGVASYTTSDLTLLGHTITAIYTGSSTDQWSTQQLRQVVNP